jgi:16S rRNA pseudouridine516 synthase
MRLDKFLSETGTASRSESKKAARSGGVTVNGVAMKDLSVHIDPEKDRVAYMDVPVVYQKYVYIMMNKPDGVISATEDGNDKTVLDLLPEKYRKTDIFPCGRLDKNTLGLLILTNNGALAHRLLSPKCHVEKTYRFECERPLTDADVELLCRGVDIGEKSSTRPATVKLSSEPGRPAIILRVRRSRSSSLISSKRALAIALSSTEYSASAAGRRRICRSKAIKAARSKRSAREPSSTS